MVKVTPEEFQEKHARRLKAALPDIRRGIEKVTESPMEKAAKKKEKMKARLIEAIDTGVWERRLRRRTLEFWKKRASEVGVARISAGIDAAKEDVIEFAEVLLPHVEKGQKIVEEMPDITLDDMVARAEKFIRHMAELKYKKL